jgi:ketosteroid isomerase-like protein
MARRFSSGSILAGTLLLVVAAWFVYVQFFNDERAIRRRMNDVAAALSTAQEGTDLARLSRVMRLRDYLAEDVTAVDEGSLDLKSRDEVLAVAARWATAGQGVTADFIDLTVSMNPDGVTAQSLFTAQLSGFDPVTRENRMEERAVMADLAKRDGRWVITAVRARRP